MPQTTMYADADATGMGTTGMGTMRAGGDRKARAGRERDRNVILAEQARMEEERWRLILQQEMEEQQRQEAAEMQQRMEEIQRAQEMEGEDKDQDQEMGAGPSVPKKRKMDDKVSVLFEL